MSSDFWEAFRTIDGGAPFAREVGHSIGDLYALDDSGPISGWQTLTYTAEVSAARDILQCHGSSRVCSSGLRAVIEACLGERDVVQWLSVDVRLPDGSSLPYWILHIPREACAPLNPKFSTMGPSGLPIRWVVDARAVEGRRIFAVEGVHTSIVVHDDVKNEVQRLGLVGLDFAKARVA